MKRALPAAVCLLWFAQPVQALAITEFAPRSSQTAEFVFSGVLQIGAVEYINDGEGGALRLPVSRGNDEREFVNIRIADQDIYREILELFGKGQPRMTGKCVLPAFRAVSWRKLEKNSRIANVDIEFDGALVVTFGLIRATRKGNSLKPYYRVMPPENFAIMDEDYKKQVREAVIEAGEKAQNEK